MPSTETLLVSTAAALLTNISSGLFVVQSEAAD